MKKLVLFLVLLLTMSGCSGTPEELQQGLDLRQKILDASELSFETDITADYGDKLHQFSMDCRADEQGNVAFTVTAPETLSGITGRISNAGGELIFDDVALFFALLTDEQLSPVSGPWILVRTLRSGYLTAACRDEDSVHLTIDDSYDDDALTLDIWLDRQELPERAEILYDGRRILTLEVRNVQIL